MRCLLSRSVLVLALLSACTPDGFVGFEPTQEFAFPSAPLEGEGFADVQVSPEDVWSIPYQVRAGRPVVDGDIVLDFDPMERSAHFDNPWGLWRRCEVAYELDPGLGRAERDGFLDAIEEWEAKTALRFREDPDADDRIRVFAGKGCYSSVGRRSGVQDLSLGAGCHTAGVHEIGHAMGLWHEQSRVDRDEHIRINLDVVHEEQHHNFLTYRQQRRTGLDFGDYDFQSVMHYGSTAFTAETCTPTHTEGCSLTKLDGSYIPRARARLSETDVASIASLYGENGCALPIPEPDDVGDTADDALSITLTPASREFFRREGNHYGDVDVYTVHITGDQPVQFAAWSVSESDTWAELHTLDGELIAENDNAGSWEDDDRNFRIEVELERGSYLLTVYPPEDYQDPDGYGLHVQRDGGGVDVSEPMFTRYLEGAGQDKFLEIGNATGSAMSLDACVVDMYTNGAAAPTATLELDGTLEPGETYLVCHSSAELVPGGPCDDRTSTLSFNGDDALVLTCGGETIDRIGQIGVDPGAGWGEPGAGTRDSGLQRACGTLPDAEAHTTFSTDGWTSFDASDASRLGTDWPCL